MHMLIDGAWTSAADGTTDEIRNPATGALIDTVPRASTEDVARAVDAAQAGKQRLAAVPAHERCAILMRVADRIEAEHDALARLLVSENGKTHREIANEVRVAVRIWRGYAEEAKRLFGRSMPLDSIPGLEQSLAHYDPPAARRRRRHRAVQLSGRTVVPQGCRGLSPPAMRSLPSRRKNAR